MIISDYRLLKYPLSYYKNLYEINVKNDVILPGYLSLREQYTFCTFLKCDFKKDTKAFRFPDRDREYAYRRLILYASHSVSMWSQVTKFYQERVYTYLPRLKLFRQKVLSGHQLIYFSY